jgi:hypothetical protein
MGDLQTTQNVSPFIYSLPQPGLLGYPGRCAQSNRDAGLSHVIQEGQHIGNASTCSVKVRGDGSKTAVR